MSGLPFHFQLYGQRAGLLDEPATGAADWRLRPERVAWNLWRVVTLRGKGGHQYTARRTRMYWPALPAAGEVVVNIFQLFPPEVLATGCRPWFFIDQTLEQLFTGYGQAEQLSRGVVDRTMAWERSCYEAAECIVVNSRWAQRSVVEDYGVQAERTAVVLQAANLDPDAYAGWAARHEPRAAADGVLRLAFVGNDWRRKGLDRLVRALSVVNTGRVRASLDVLGLTADQVPAELRGVAGVTWHGFVDKAREQGRFLDLLGSADVGCLLSRAEAGGNSLREYHACGLAVLGTSAGGAGEQTLPGAAWLVDPDEDLDAVVGRLRQLLDDRDLVDEAKRLAWRSREEVLWPATLRGFAEQLHRRGA